VRAYGTRHWLVLTVCRGGDIKFSSLLSPYFYSSMAIAMFKLRLCSSRPLPTILRPYMDAYAISSKHQAVIFPLLLCIHSPDCITLKLLLHLLSPLLAHTRFFTVQHTTLKRLLKKFFCQGHGVQPECHNLQSLKMSPPLQKSCVERRYGVGGGREGASLDACPGSCTYCSE
jgi:hypothetical protein